MNILVVNCGSSSLKYQLIRGKDESVCCKGICERIGQDGSTLIHQKSGAGRIELKKVMSDHQQAVAVVLEMLQDPEHGVIGTLSEIDAVGHRVVHGGEQFARAVLIDSQVLSGIEACSQLAPLHNPANLVGIRACQALMGGLPMVGVFDTAFHQTMPERAFLYGLPYEYYLDHGVRKYGFHGTSHQFVAEQAAVMLGKKLTDSRLIICHLGNGASISAVAYGKSVDTSMGFTPLEGLIMGTRSGDLDPAIIEYIAKKENKSISEVIEILNKKSGVLGLSGNTSSDFRDLVAAGQSGNKLAQTALEACAYRVAKYIGAYAAAMNGADAVVFTAGAGENNLELRSMVLPYLSYLGVIMDEQSNRTRGEQVMLTVPGSAVAAMVIPTNEELMIARETMALI